MQLSNFSTKLWFVYSLRNHNHKRTRSGCHNSSGLSREERRRRRRATPKYRSAHASRVSLSMLTFDDGPSHHRLCLSGTSESGGVQHGLCGPTQIAPHTSAGQEAFKDRNPPAGHLLHRLPKPRPGRLNVTIASFCH